MNATLIQGNAEVPAPATLAALCLDAWTLSLDIASQSEELEAKKAAIAEALENNGTVLIPGTCRVTCSERSSISIADAEGLAKALGRRFADLVKEKTSYSPTDNLKKIAADSAHPDHEAVKRWMQVSRSFPVLMKADTPDEKKSR